jgi:hypothetical protein
MLFKQKELYFLTAAFIILINMFGFVSCRHDPFFISEMDTICFEEQILPVLQNSCGISGCHDGTGESEDFDATDYASVIKSVTPGDVYASKLYQVITDIWGENMMPPDRPLTIEQRTAIHIWIAQGAKNTSCSVPPPDTSGNGNNGNGNGGNLPDDTICFVQDILPVFIANCATTGCHDATTQRDGYVLTSYANITDLQESIIPFDPDASKLFKVITEDDPGDRMPPPPLTALSSDQIQKLRKWIEDGALNSNCPETTCDTTGIIGFSSRILPIFQNYCVSCHNSTNPRGDVNLDNYTGIKTLADTEINGIPVLIGTIRKLNGFTPMPPDGSSVPDCDIRQIEIWIDQGKHNN